MARLELAEARNLELSPRLPCEWQETDHLSHDLMIPRVHVSRKLELGMEMGLEPRHSDMAVPSYVLAQGIFAFIFHGEETFREFHVLRLE